MELLARIGIAVSVVAASIVALALPTSATASSAPACSNPGSGSAIDQYVQCWSTAGGKVAVGVGKEKTTQLGHKATEGLKSVSKPVREKLEEMATSSLYGNPTNKLVADKRATNLDSSVGRSLLATIIAPGAGSEGRLLGLLIAIVTITALAGVAAARKKRV